MNILTKINVEKRMIKGILLCLSALIFLGCDPTAPIKYPKPTHIYVESEPEWSSVVTPDGTKGYAFRCDNLIHCAEQSGNLCPHGYDVLASQNVSPDVAMMGAAKANDWAVFGCAMSGIDFSGDPIAGQIAQARADECIARAKAEAEQNTRNQFAQEQARNISEAEESRYLMISCFPDPNPKPSPENEELKPEPEPKKLEDIPPTPCGMDNQCPEGYHCGRKQGEFTGYCKPNN